MQRKIIKIDEDKCNGCGLCIDACHEGALELVNGKAKLVSESYCDGLGDCLPECPTGAITLEERETQPFDEQKVAERIAQKSQEASLACGCPSQHMRSFDRKSRAVSAPVDVGQPSELRQWPVQLKLVPVNATYFAGAHLLVAVDCAAYAYRDMHAKFMRGKVTVIGCPKLDDVDYAQKLAEILKTHDVKSLTVVRMEVPCCGGIVSAAKHALTESGKMIPWRVVTLSTDGEIIEDM